ncbi:MAG: hypothetical protein H6719_00595 [Sandaracinaceae bacterium]|nr:hypothetical protein [Sandaracinaceae bacterium]
MLRSTATSLAPSLLALCLLAAPAAAQDANRARQLFEQGVSAMDSGNPALAAQYFEQSYQQFPRASSACNLALALERTGRGCEAISWYRQCAALDTAGTFRDHAGRQAAALSSQCPSTTQSPFVSGPQTSGGGGGGVQVVESGQPTAYRRHYDYDHTMLGVGIPALLLGIGAFVGGGFAADEARWQAGLIPMYGFEPSGDPMNPTTLPAGSGAADAYDQAQLMSNLAIGLYVTGSVLSLVGAILIVVDLARPGVFDSDTARGTPGPRLAVGSLPEGGGVARLTLAF